MKVEELACLLDSLAAGLEQIKGAAPLAKDARVFTAAFRPFAGRTVAEFTNFLLQCEEYQRTGVVSGKKTAAPRAAAKAADPEAISRAVQTVQALLADIRQGHAGESRIEEVLAPLAKLTKPQLDGVCASLNIAGKARSKAQALDRVRQVLRTQLEMEGKVRAIQEGEPTGPAAE